MIERGPLLRRALAVALAATLIYQVHALAVGAAFSRELLAQSLDRNGGEAVSLAPEVVEARRLVADRGIGALQLAPSIASDPSLEQRTTEALYPVRMVDSRAPMLARRRDADVVGCVELSHSALMGLYDCHARK